MNKLHVRFFINEESDYLVFFLVYLFFNSNTELNKSAISNNTSNKKFYGSQKKSEAE